ncbi:hypothetical protein WGC32_13760 [Zongyangia sp. HA2173]|uniref:hypothetical protein n=1 Tax=Zongyangia sp. HA2173 TaxID=3133035 RepID=UPI003165876E
MKKADLSAIGLNDEQIEAVQALYNSETRKWLRNNTRVQLTNTIVGMVRLLRSLDNLRAVLDVATSLYKSEEEVYMKERNAR